MGGHSTIIVYGKSAKAAMLYEANGHTIVTCALNPPKANTEALDKSAAALNKNLKYMTPKQQADAINVARQGAFGSMTVKNNSLTGLASENALYSGGGGNDITTTKPPVINLGFSFDYDPVEGFSTVAAGGTYHRHTSSAGVDEFGHMEHSQTDDIASAGMGAATDPSEAHLTGGAAPQQSDPDAAYIKVTKTARGFNVKWTKHVTQPNVNGVTDEEFTADIGEPLQEYEAILRPMPDTKYETWLPKGPKVDGSDDTKGDDSQRFYVVVRDKNDSTKAYAGNYTVKYKIREITHYKGFNSNYPVTGADQTPDFKIAKAMTALTTENGVFDAQSVTDTTISSKTGKGNGAIVQLTCMDYGAWTRLNAEVTLDNGSVLYACPYYDRTDTAITVPFDVDKNKIADAWEKFENVFNKGYGFSWDEDVRPDNHHDGDNMPLIDEYRGFLTEDDDYKPVYKRFSPQVKELITIGLVDKSANGAVYKEAIKIGALGYTRVTNVKVYHLTDSKYGKKEDGSSLKYGRWVNYNSPQTTHTHGVVIYAYDTPSPRVDGAGVLANTGPTFSLTPIPDGYEGGQVPDDTNMIELWAYNIANTNDYTIKAPSWYLPRPQGNDDFNQTANSHIRHANDEFHLNMDIYHFGNVVRPRVPQLVNQLISFTIAHELCHATNIPHHRFSEGDPGSYKGVSTCPVRYWLDWTQEDSHADWLPMFFSGAWNPATMTTPYGDRMSLCTVADNCFSKLRLKK